MHVTRAYRRPPHTTLRGSTAGMTQRWWQTSFLFLNPVWEGWLPFKTPLTTAELVATQLTLQNLLLQGPPEKVVIFGDSCGALQQLLDEHKAGIFVRSIAVISREAAYPHHRLRQYTKV